MGFDRPWLAAAHLRHRVHHASENTGDLRELMNNSRPPLFVAPIFAKVFTAVLVLAVAGIGAAILIQGTIAARDIAGTLISAVIFAYWVHLLVIARQDSEATRE